MEWFQSNPVRKELQNASTKASAHGFTASIHLPNERTNEEEKSTQSWRIHSFSASDVMWFWCVARKNNNSVWITVLSAKLVKQLANIKRPSPYVVGSKQYCLPSVCCDTFSTNSRRFHPSWQALALENATEVMALLWLCRFVSWPCVQSILLLPLCPPSQKANHIVFGTHHKRRGFCRHWFFRQKKRREENRRHPCRV